MGEHKVKMIIEVPQTRIEDFVLHAIRLGYLRENPQKAWSAEEKRRVVRWLANKLMEQVPTSEPPTT